MKRYRFGARRFALASILLTAILSFDSSSSAITASGGNDRTGALTSIHSARLSEPFVATASTLPQEDIALSIALEAYKRRTRSDDDSALHDFVKQHPHSGWAAAVWVNLGNADLHYGYFSRALDAWRHAWDEGKAATDPHARALVDGAVGNLAQLYASLGQFDNLVKFRGDIRGRAVTGSATEALQYAQELEAQSVKDPRHLYLCGPVALKALLLATGAKYERVRFLDQYRATPRGTSLGEVGRLADQASMPHRLVTRSAGQAVPVPSIVHWKVGHFAAIIGQAHGRYHVQDPIFPGEELWVTPEALDAESSGYYIVPASVPNNPAWKAVDKSKAETVWGRGPTASVRAGDPGDKKAHGKNNNCPMCSYNINESAVSITISDTPVGYTPAVGPSAKVSITYNQREDSQPQNFNFFNVSPKWTLNWLTYVTDDPANPGANVSRFMPEGGAFYYTAFNAVTGGFATEDTDGSKLFLISQAPIRYERRTSDGSIEVYSTADGATGYPRKVFLTERRDPQGNAITLHYDGAMRLTSLQDAAGRNTIFTYGVSSSPLLVTKITDPFGRAAALTYDTSGRLASITDIIGITSQFSYDANSLVNVLTTPYGATQFAYTAPGTSGPPRYAQATDPLGYNEREEWLEPAPIPDSDPAATVPQGMPLLPTNTYLTYRDSFYWDRDAYVAAGCSPTGGCDYTKSRDTHFLHFGSQKSTTVESIKQPLENRVWYQYPGQTSSIQTGTYASPNAVGRVLDDGTTQLSSYDYDTNGFYKLTEVVDPEGRTTHLTYTDHVDLSGVSQVGAGGRQVYLAQFIYNAQHRPVIAIDAAFQATTYTYNTAGQVLTVTNPLGEITKYNYLPTGELSSIINAKGHTAASYTYDAFDRVATYTDSEGWMVAYTYDAADRVTRKTYPDGTSEIYAYNKLDLASYQDRQGRRRTYIYDADRRLTSTTDPMGQQAQYTYNGKDQPLTFKDPKGNITSWAYDIEGRLITKTLPDSTVTTYSYENTTSRLASTTDALSQVKHYAYGIDDLLTGVSYTNALNTTPGVSYAYDTYFRRVQSMSDGTGTTSYAYVSGGQLGALKLQLENGPQANSTLSYGYDALGRLTTRSVAGAGAETFQYDVLGRVTTLSNDLGAFQINYLGDTAQITQRQLTPATADLQTSWSYLNNSGDRRLSAIGNTGLSSSQQSNYAYGTNNIDQITSVAESGDVSPVYPPVAQQTVSYNNLNQITAVAGQAYSYDADGNLLSDGLRNYSWDAEGRLIGITYPGTPGKQTAFSYDGQSRRTSITSTPAGGTASTISYLWCGSSLCQSRNAAGTPTREYLAEGEYVPGVTPQALYYGTDKIGSVRRVFASASNAPAYSYDAYGNALQSTPMLTDFGYAGMFYNADSGLYLTQFRAYDPRTGRWISRDPIGEMGDPSGNLYGYVADNPISLTDYNGLICWPNLTAPLLYDLRTFWLAWQEFNDDMKPFIPMLGSTPLGPIARYSAAATEAVSAAAAEEALSFSQTTASPMFSLDGTFSGQSIADVASQLRTGSMAASDVPVATVNLADGNLIVNTRSALALMQAGVPQTEWSLINMTGDAATEANISQRLLSNGLPNSGTPVLRITGSGPNTSTLIP